MLTLDSGKRFKADVLLWANGRSGATDKLELKNAGLTPNNRKQIEVDEFFRSEVPHIYAVGDVVGAPGLASAGYDQGRFAGTHIAEGIGDSRLISDIPTGIYTDPEISSIGLTEAELTEHKVPLCDSPEPATGCLILPRTPSTTRLWQRPIALQRLTVSIEYSGRKMLKIPVRQIRLPLDRRQDRPPNKLLHCALSRAR